MRTLQVLATMALLVTAARADGIPWFSYFYPCAGEAVDCSKYPANRTNDKGESIFSDIGVATYRSATGQVYQLGESFNAVAISDTGLYVFNGFPGMAYVGSSDELVLGETNTPESLANFTDLTDLNADYGFEEYGISFVVSQMAPLGIDSSNGILMNLSFGTALGLDSSAVIEGVLSPTPIPEPSALLLFAAVIGLCIPRLSRAKSSRSQQLTPRH